MSYVNVGVKALGSDIPTKAQLKRLVDEDYHNVMVYTTDIYAEGNLEFVGDRDIYVKYSVVGPNPYTSRKWYATIEWNTKKNKWVVK